MIWMVCKSQSRETTDEALYMSLKKEREREKMNTQFD